MAKLKKKIPLKGLRGKVGDLVFRQTPAGSIVVSLVCRVATSRSSLVRLMRAI